MTVLELEWTDYGYKVSLPGKQDGEYYKKSEVDEFLKWVTYNSGAHVMKAAKLLLSGQDVDAAIDAVLGED